MNENDPYPDERGTDPRPYSGWRRGSLGHRKLTRGEVLTTAKAERIVNMWLTQNNYFDPQQHAFDLRQLAMNWDPSVNRGVITLEYYEGWLIQQKRKAILRDLFRDSIAIDKELRGVHNKQILGRTFTMWWGTQVDLAKGIRWKMEDDRLVRLFGPTRQHYRPYDEMEAAERAQEIDLS